MTDPAEKKDTEEENHDSGGIKNFGIKMMMLQVFLITLAVLLFLGLITLKKVVSGE